MGLSSCIDVVLSFKLHKGRYIPIECVFQNTLCVWDIVLWFVLRDNHCGRPEQLKWLPALDKRGQMRGICMTRDLKWRKACLCHNNFLREPMDSLTVGAQMMFNAISWSEGWVFARMGKEPREVSACHDAVRIAERRKNSKRQQYHTVLPWLKSVHGASVGDSHW